MTLLAGSMRGRRLGQFVSARTMILVALVPGTSQSRPAYIRLPLALADATYCHPMPLRGPGAHFPNDPQARSSVGHVLSGAGTEHIGRPLLPLRASYDVIAGLAPAGEFNGSCAVTGCLIDEYAQASQKQKSELRCLPSKLKIEWRRIKQASSEQSNKSRSRERELEK